MEKHHHLAAPGLLDEHSWSLEPAADWNVDQVVFRPGVMRIFEVRERTTVYNFVALHIFCFDEKMLKIMIISFLFAYKGFEPLSTI